MTKKGLDNFSADLEKSIERAENLNGRHSVPLGDLMNRDFMSEHTSHSELESWLEAGGFSAQNAEEFNAIDSRQLDEYVARSTSFKDWEEMYDEAIGDWGFNQIFGR